MSEESTTRDLAELARRFADALNSGDLDLVMSFFAPDAVTDHTAIGLEFNEGRAAIRESIEALLGAYDRLDTSFDEGVYLGNGVSFVVWTATGRLGSGELNVRWGAVVDWQDGLIARSTLYTDIDEARAAAERLAEDQTDG